MASTKLLANTLKNILSDPVEGFTVELIDEANMFDWKVYLEGPKDTLYEGGVFQLTMKFPSDFPMSPPELRFLSDFWHPNVYKDTGLVCISILHPPGEDEMSGESANERWLPTQTVSTILLSVISLLNAPNFSSPANVDAGVQWRNDPIGYKKKCQRLVEMANREKPSHVVIPHPDTNKEEREKQIQKMKALTKPMEMDDDDFMNEIPDDYEDDDDASVESQSVQEESTEESSEKEDKKSKTKGKTEETTASSSKDGKRDEVVKKKKKKQKSRHSEADLEKKEKEIDSNSNSNEVMSQNRSGNSTEKTKRRKNKKCIIM